MPASIAHDTCLPSGLMALAVTWGTGQGRALGTQGDGCQDEGRRDGRLQPAGGGKMLRFAE